VRHKIHTGTDHRIQGRVQFSQVTLEIVDRHYLLKSFLNKRVFFNQKYCLLLLLFDVNIISNRVQCKSQISVKWSICSTIKASRNGLLPLTVLVVTLYFYHRSSLLLSFYNFCNIPRLLSISAMMRKLRRHKQQNNLDYTMIVCLPQVCHCLKIQHVLHLRPLQNVPIRSPTLLLQMCLRFQHQNMRLVECKFNKTT
jgi:hypothetical protein